MKIKTRFVSFLVLLVAITPALSAGEVERLRTLVAEQEMQIQQLELKLAQLAATPSPTPVSTPAPPAPVPTTPPPSIPATPATTAETCPEPAKTENPEFYSVVAGDNMAIIARKHGTSSATLNKLNGLKSTDIIRPGQKLKLPTSSTTDVAVTEQIPLPVAAPIDVKSSSDTSKHTVVDKETYYSIAKKYKISIDALIKENPSINPNTIRVGQIVQIPGNKQVADATPTPNSDQPPSLTSRNHIPVSNQSSTASQLRASEKPIKITKNIKFKDFADSYNTTPDRLNQLNGLHLDPTIVLAPGSELYIPAQP